MTSVVSSSVSRRLPRPDGRVASPAGVARAGGGPLRLLGPAAALAGAVLLAPAAWPSAARAESPAPAADGAPAVPGASGVPEVSGVPGAPAVPEVSAVPEASAVAEAPAPAPGAPEPTVEEAGPAPGGPPLTLEECFRIAASRSERVGRASERYEQALSVKRNARAAVLPRLTLEDSYFRQNEVELMATGGVATAFTFAEDRNDVFLRLQQPIFSGFRDRNFLAFAGHNIEAFRHGVDESRRLLYADVAQAFYSVLQRQGEVETLEDSVAVERERLREVRARHEVGLARRTELLLVEAQLAEDEANLTRARNDLLVARERLGFLMGQPVERPLSDDLALPAALGEARPAIEEAMESRSDMRQLARAVEAARHQVAVARGEYYPSIDLEARAFLDRRNVSEFAQETDWTAEVTFTFPIFDGGRARAGVADAHSRLQQAILDRNERARQVALEVESAWLTLESDLRRLETLETSVASADENYRLVQEEYRAGLATNLEVITAQNLLLSSRLERERQRYQVKLDGVALRLAQGMIPGAGAEPPSGEEEPAPQEAGAEAQAQPSAAASGVAPAPGAGSPGRLK